MWFLQLNSLLLIVAFSFATGILRRHGPTVAVQKIIPIASLAVIAYISVPLAVFTLLYSAAGLFFARILRVAERGKKVLFPLFCLLALVPFFMGRAGQFGLELPFPLVSTGLAFQLLKLIDGLYYTYYSGEAVQALPFFQYMFYLPTFTAGPIFRYRDFLQTSASPLPLSVQELTSDVQRMIRGLFKKVVLAAMMVKMLDKLLTLTPSIFVSILVVAGSWLLLYWDLSGYSDIAIACGRIGGLKVPENFKHPLRAPTFTQFWRSWHATVSDWIREHIYVVIAKKKVGKYKSALIALITMVVMGLWHGFNPLYLLAGFYNGALLALENLLSLTTVKRKKANKYILFLRCLAVNLLFGVNTLVFTLTPEQIAVVLRGFIS